MSTSVPNNLISTFGGIPNFIVANVADFKVEGENYTCELCNTIIGCISDSKSQTTTCFTNHLEGSFHKDNSIERQSRVNDFGEIVKEFFHKTFPPKDIPPIIFANVPFLTCDQKNTKCTLCKKSIDFSTRDLIQSENNIVRHLLSDKHKDKVKEFYNKCNTVKVHLENDKVYGTTPPPVVDNVEFIVATFGDYNYQCNLCMDKFYVVDKSSGEQFLAHFRSVEHNKKADHHRVIVKVPSRLANLYQSEQIPYYIVNNIEYIICNKFCTTDIYCSLCNKCITNGQLFTDSSPQQLYKIQQSLKCHLLSKDHEEHFFSKLDFQNKCYRRLHRIFESFPIPVQKCFKYLGVKDANFYCLSCKAKINIESECYETKRNILAHFLVGEESIEYSVHEENEINKMLSCKKVESKLREMFGSIPDEIEQSIVYFSAPIDDKYIECLICEGNKKLQLNGREILKHLSSTSHRSSVLSLKNRGKETEKALCEHFTPDNFSRTEVEFYPISKYIQKNLFAISYKDTSKISEYGYERFFSDDSSDDEDYQHESSKSVEKKRVEGKNLQCNICKEVGTKPISVILISKCEFRSDIDDLNRKQTEYNLRTHFLSQEHKYNLQMKEIISFLTLTKLEQLFKVIPSYARNNINHMVSVPFTSYFYCNLCSNYIPSDKSSFETHFFGNCYSETILHQSKEAETEQSNTIAMGMLEMKFHQIPRVVLRDIDFLSECGANLFCELCQETLFIEENDVERTKSNLCLHMRSQKHMVVLKGVRRTFAFKTTFF